VDIKINQCDVPLEKLPSIHLWKLWRTITHCLHQVIYLYHLNQINYQVSVFLY